MKKQFFTLLMLLLATTLVAKANPVDMRTVREVAVKFVNANSRTLLRGVEDLQLVTTYRTDSDDAAFHIFNTPNGFVIVSADDCATPILGYSDEGQFDTENIPIQLQDYLQSFVEQIQYGIENHLEANEEIERQWELVRRTGYLNENRDGEVVEPLITAMWGQDCYYNAMCPVHENGPCGHCYTGCVATAMGMILHYWGYPLQSSVSYGGITYDWANMPDQLTATSTQAEINAVSTLLWHCGLAVNMSYSPNGSAAFSNDVPNALKDYFNYADDIHLESRQDDEIWLSLLKTDLDLGCPVFYSGNPSYGAGHAFVCDGYDVNDRFHFNFGWSGGSNGYFALNAISYHYNNAAVFNIHPNANVTHQVTASVNPSDGGTIAGTGTYGIGSICTLTATANTDYAFMYWTEDGEVVSTQAEFSFCVRKDRDLVAHFAPPIHVEVVSLPIEGGSVSGVGEHAYGSTCTLTAIPNEGYDFICWRRTNGSVVTTAPTYTFTVTEAIILTAVFAASGGEQIPFADLNVKAICVAYWDTNGDGELSYAEAAAVTSLWGFSGNTEITLFEELRYFTGLTSIGNFAFSGCNNLLGSLYIPNSVTTIGEYAFHNCSGFTGSLSIPNSVTTIGSNAFFGCHGFTGDLIIPNSVTTIERGAFNGCYGFNGNLIIGNSLTTIGIYAFKDCTGFTGSLIIPNTVTTIGGAAFSGCSGFTGNLVIPNSMTTIEWGTFDGCTGFTGSLTVPNSVIEIGSGAFYSCSGFTGSLTIGNSVTSIGNDAFVGCSGFTGSLTIPSSVTSIGERAFYECSGFTGNLIIPNTVTSIGEQAFWYCTGFTGSLTIPNSVTSIGNAAFGYCTGFTGNLIIGNSVTSIGNGAFVGCCSFTGDLTIPNSVTEIGSEAFSHCSGFTGSLTIGNSVTSIGWQAFDGCSGFVGDLVIPNSVNEIGWRAFYGCSGFTGDLTIGNSVTTIESYAFCDCSGFTGSLTIGNSVTSIGNSAFYNCSGFTGSLTIGNSVTSIEGNAFNQCSGFTGSLSIPNSVTSIGNAAFANCSGFTGSLTIPNSVTTIGEYAFSWCSGFTGNLIIGNSVTSIGNGAFWKCSGFTGDLIIGNSVTSIGNSAFWNCSGFTGNLTIGNSVTSINNSAFNNCSGLTSITVLANNPPALGIASFVNVSNEIPVYVPCGSEEAYASINWGSFNNIIGLCGGTITVSATPEEYGMVTGGGVFEAGESCTVTAIANEGYAFAIWTQAGTIVSTDAEYTFYVPADWELVAHFVPEGNIVFADDNVKSICVSHWDTNGDGELSYEEAAIVKSLSDYFRNNTEITLFDELQYFIGLTSIGHSAFYDCTGLTSIAIPISVNAIGNRAFYNCSGLTGSLTIANSVTEIGSEAFSGCSGFTDNLTIGSSVTSIGWGAFSGCSGFTGSLTIPNSVNSISVSAFQNCSGFSGSLTIPNSVTSIGIGAFKGCSGFTGNLTIPNSVTEIGSEAFYNCSGFTGSLTIPNSVITIGDYAFSWCSGFTGDLIIGNSVTSVGECVFWNCSGFMGNLTIGNSVTSLGTAAFSCCSGLTSITVLANNPPTLENDYVFDGVNKSIPVYVPCGSLAAYQSAAYWNEFTNIQETCSQSQTVDLTAGWNWFSPNVEITLENLQDALVNALPNANSIMIKSKNGISTYNGDTWRGQLESLDVTQMYRIFVGTACEITLEGNPINPVAHPITIYNGANWIAFPFSESMSLSDAFAGFAVSGDVVKSKNNGIATFNGTNWRGTLNTLVPGQGYIYKSNVQGDRTFTFPASTK